MLCTTYGCETHAPEWVLASSLHTSTDVPPSSVSIAPSSLRVWRASVPSAGSAAMNLSLRSCRHALFR